MVPNPSSPTTVFTPSLPPGLPPPPPFLSHCLPCSDLIAPQFSSMYYEEDGKAVKINVSASTEIISCTSYIYDTRLTFNITISMSVGFVYTYYVTSDQKCMKRVAEKCQIA